MKPTAILLQANRTAIILNMTQKAKNQQKPKKKSHLKSKNHNRESNLGEKKTIKHKQITDILIKIVTTFAVSRREL